MISPRIDKLLDHVDSDYASVIVAAKRARQINSYYLTIALEEVAQGKLKYHYR